MTLQQYVVDIEGGGNLDSLKAACRSVVDEQPILRSRLRNGENGFLLEPVPAAMVAVKGIDHTRLVSKTETDRREQFLREDRERGRHQDDLPFCRFTLIQFGPTEASLVWTVSSLLVDRESIGIVFRRIFEYWKNSSIEPFDPEEVWLKVRQWCLQHAGLAGGQNENYWRTHLKDAEPQAWLPPRTAGEEQHDRAVTTAQLDLSLETTTRLTSLAREQGLDWATIAETTWALLIQRYRGGSDVLFAAGRGFRGEAEKHLAGVFTNLVLRRLAVPRQGALLEWLCQEKARSSEAAPHGRCPLSTVMRWAGLPQHGAWLTSLVRVEDPRLDDEILPAGSQLKAFVRTKYEMPGVPVVATMCIGKRITLELVGDALKVNDLTASQLLRHWGRLLDQLARKPSLDVAAFSLLSDSERKIILHEWNQTEAPFPSEPCVHHLFARQAALTPDWTAVSMGGDSLSYRRLDALSDALAASLSAQGVRADSSVAICLPRSLELPVAVLGVLKSGGAYLPIDPAYPPERIGLMLEDSRAQVLITRQDIQESIRMGSIPVLPLESIRSLSELPHPFTPPETPSSEQLAYVLYTSGSTGRPKGVAMGHSVLVNLIEWQKRVSANLPPGARTIQFSALSFDVSFQEMFSTLCSGGELVLISEEIRRNPSALWQFIARHAINRIFLPFVALQQLAEAAAGIDDAPESLQEVITAGEQLQITPQLAQLFGRLRRATLHNQYGPTETHVVTSLTLNGDPVTWPALPSIGRPIANARIYILDETRKPLPVGVAGEIYIGGKALARGYLNRPEITAERFLPDPFKGSPTARLYRTGDLGRFQADGCIEFMGRADDQVKIRGYRVELAEVEAALRKDPSVGDCVVNPWAYNGENRLVAYVVTTQPVPFDEAPLRERVRSVLPDYMCPSFYVSVERFPLTPSGKVDRRALPEPVLERSAVSIRFEPPLNPLETSISLIWQEVLGIGAVGRNDRFFDLGGTSLLMIRVHRKLEEVLARRIPITMLFQHPTVAALALHLDEPNRPDDSRQQELQARAARQRQAMARQAGARSALRRRDA